MHANSINDHEHCHDKNAPSINLYHEGEHFVKNYMNNRRRKNNDRKDLIFRLKLDSIDENTGLEIIDWLAFKKEIEEISFFADSDQSIYS